MLLLAEKGFIFEKKNCKKHTVQAPSASNSKIIFALLAKVIAFQVGLTIV